MRITLLCLSIVISPLIYAHDDIDIGISEIRLNKDCKAEVVLVNNGRNIPSYFYRKPTPASLTITKSNITEELGSLSLLDEKRTLQNNGGRLKVISKNTYENLPQAITASLDFFGEFYDHGGDDNSVTKEIDCIAGVGQIKGEKNLPRFPDIKLGKAFVDPITCQLNVKFHNLTGIPLTESSWDNEGGAFLMQLNLDNNIRLNDIALIDIDPKQSFTQASQVLTWQNPKKISGVKSLRVGVWRVKDDLDFSNNHLELSVPKTCW